MMQRSKTIPADPCPLHWKSISGCSPMMVYALVSLAVLIPLIFLGTPAGASAQTTEAVSQFDIRVSPGSPRTYFYTNREDSYWYAESNAFHSSASQGWHYRRQLIFNDLFIAVDGQLLDRSRAQATVTPVSITRRYPQQHVTERLYFPDHLHALVVEVMTDTTRRISFLPGFFRSDKTIEVKGSLARVVQQKYLTPSGLPLTMFLEVNKPGRWERADTTLTLGSKPAEVPIRWDGISSDTCRIILTLSNDAAGHSRQRNRWRLGLAGRQESLAMMREQPVTDNPQLNKALLWARQSVGAMQAQLDGAGFLAGIPEDDWYYSRESLLSIAGGALVNNNYPLAKEILREIGEHQNTTKASREYGLIPKRWLPGCTEYNAADVTPLLVIGLEQYLRYSGDFAFAQEMYPVIYRAIEGSLQYRVSEEGYLLNAPGGTWMDAWGINGPWTPRSDRAVEIQALWYAQLQAGVRIARMLGFDETASRWKQAIDNLKAHFETDFWDTKRAALYDALTAEGTPELAYRPNQIFAISLSKDLLPPDRQGKVLRAVLAHNTYPRGVSTLSQTNPEFHPFQSAEPFYSRNAALQNGLVWPWLTGPVVSSLVRFGALEPASGLMDHLSRQILNAGMIGALPRTESAFSGDLLPSSLKSLPVDTLPEVGAYTPAMAEYLCAWNQDFFGIHPDAFQQQVTFVPRLPEGVAEVSKMVRMGGSEIDVQYRKSVNQFTFRLQNTGDPVAIQFEIRRGDSLYTLAKPFQLAQIPVPIAVHFNYERKVFILDEQEIRTTVTKTDYATELSQPVELVQPEFASDLSAFRPPNHVLLSGAQATHMYETARSIVDVKDPTGDDFGPRQSYQYPLSPVFAPGIFDLTGFAVRTDDQYVYFDLYFRNLVQPRWHPEYGFQLTYAAIGIHTGASTGTRRFSMDASYAPGTDEPMQYILYVGGGFRLVGAAGKTLVEYRPSQTGYPMANLRENKIHIAIPIADFPQVKKWWKYTIVTGGQQDYGGGGLGVFRSVGETPCLWRGGGKTDPAAPNWYDLLQVGFEQ